MKYLITGGNGFIGIYIKTKLINNSIVVKTLGKSKFNDYQVDLSQDHLEIDEDFDIIIHSASIVHDSSHSNNYNQELIFKDIEITLNFIKCINNISFQKLIFLSSVSVYGVVDGIDIDINQKQLPKSGYGLSKSISEKILLKNIIQEKLLVLRLPLVNGPNPKGNIKKALNAINSGKMFLFNGNKAMKSVLELDDLYTFIVSKSSKFNGIHQIKSYDIRFNDFIRGLSSNRIYHLPHFLLKLLLFSSKRLKISSLQRTLSKISKDLTFLDSTKK